jgi:hypothetical protein
MLLAAIPGVVGDGNSVNVLNTVGVDSKSVTTKVGKVGQLKRLLTGPIDAEIMRSITKTLDDFVVIFQRMKIVYTIFVADALNLDPEQVSL